MSGWSDVLRGPIPPITLTGVAVVLWLMPGMQRTTDAVFEDRSEYLAVTSALDDGAGSVLWVFDVRTEELLATAWDRSSGSMKALAIRPVSLDLKATIRQR